MQDSQREGFSFNLESLELWLIEGKPCFLFFRLWIIVLIWIEVIYGIMCFEMVLMILWGLVLIIEYLGDFYLLWDWFKLFESLNCGLKSCLKAWFDELWMFYENGGILIIFDHGLWWSFDIENLCIDFGQVVYCFDGLKLCLIRCKIGFIGGEVRWKNRAKMW